MTRRDLTGFSDLPVSTFESLDSFEASIVPDGLLTINYGGTPLDILNVRRNSKHTLIVFHSALSQKMQILLVFSGQQLAKEHGMNIVSISDPSLTFNDSLNLAWFLGNRKQSLIEDIPRILDHIMDSHIGSGRIYFGASGGGFAALLHSRLVQGAITIVANPRIDLHARPRQDLGPYLRSCFGVSGRTAGQRVMRNNIVVNLTHLYAAEYNNRVVYIQNVRDRLYFRDNMMQFIECVEGSSTVNTYLGDFGVGHRPVPRSFLGGVIEAISGDGKDEFEELSKVGFLNRPTIAKIDEWALRLLEL